MLIWSLSDHSFLLICNFALNLSVSCLVFFIPFLRVCVSKIAMVVSFLVGGGGAGVVVVVVLFFVDVPIAARSRRTAVVMLGRRRTLRRMHMRQVLLAALIPGIPCFFHSFCACVRV